MWRYLKLEELANMTSTSVLIFLYCLVRFACNSHAMTIAVTPPSSAMTTAVATTAAEAVYADTVSTNTTAATTTEITTDTHKTGSAATNETSLTPDSPCLPQCSVCERDSISGEVYKVKCSGVNPLNIPDTVQEMEISNCSLPGGILNKDILANKSKLQLLMLERCGINTISSDALQKLSSVSRLYLNNNNISFIEHRTFQNLTNLKELNLASNSITSINDDTFFGLPNVIFLALSNNNITTIAPNSFKYVQNVEGIFLASNKINSLDSSIFSGLSALRMVDVSNNNIKAIPDATFSDTSLEYLDLTSNRLQSVPAEAIQRVLGSLQDLFLGYNQITTLDANIFEGFKFNSLKLNGNNLSNIDSLAFNNVTAVITDLRDNRLKTLPIELLYFLQESLSVYIGNNPWLCNCDTLWFLKFIREEAELSNLFKYKESELSQDPTCGEPATYENVIFLDAVSLVEAQCQTTTSVSSTTIVTTDLEISTTDVTSTVTDVEADLATTAVMDTSTTSTDTTTTKSETTINQAETKGYVTTVSDNSTIAATLRGTESVITQTVVTSGQHLSSKTVTPTPTAKDREMTELTTKKVRSRKPIKDTSLNNPLAPKTKTALGVVFGSLGVILMLVGLHVAFRKFNLRSKLRPKRLILPQHVQPNTIPPSPASVNPTTTSTPDTKPTAERNANDRTERNEDLMTEDKRSEMKDEIKGGEYATTNSCPSLPQIEV